MDPIVSSALIKSGAGLVGGLLGRDKGPSLREQRNNQKKIELNRFKWLRDGALAAGFNPESVLKATGGQSFGHRPIPQSPLNTGAIIGEAIGNFADAFDPIRIATQRTQLELMQHELAQAREKTAAMSGMQTTASPTGTGGSEIAAASFIPATTYAPIPKPYAVATRVLRDDGLPSANPESPAIWDEDMWVSLRAGDFSPFMGEILGRNVEGHVSDVGRKIRDAYGWTVPAASGVAKRVGQWSRTVPPRDPAIPKDFNYRGNPRGTLPPLGFAGAHPFH